MKNIAVIYGGYSAEHEISVLSGKYIASQIDKTKFNVFEILLKKDAWTLADTEIKIDKRDFSFVVNNEKIKIDVAVIVIHGTPGEDGILQSYFDILNIPYTTCTHIVAGLTFNKFFCNNYIKNFNVNVAESIMLKKNDKNTELVQKFANKVGFPVFIKPNEGGSSFGTFKVKNNSGIAPAVESAFEHSSEVIVEQFIKGRELTCGVVKIKDKITAFTPCEIVSKNEFFDYDAKYNSALNEEIIPAPFADEILTECKNLSVEIYDKLNCKGIVRIDYIVNNNKLYFLEVNTIPGMTSESIVPKMLRYDNIDIQEVMTELITEQF